MHLQLGTEEPIKVLPRVYHHKNRRKTTYDEMTRLIENIESNVSTYEKRS